MHAPFLSASISPINQSCCTFAVFVHKSSIVQQFSIFHFCASMMVKLQDLLLTQYQSYCIWIGCIPFLHVKLFALLQRWKIEQENIYYQKMMSLVNSSNVQVDDFMTKHFSKCSHWLGISVIHYLLIFEISIQQKLTYM